MTGTSMQNGSGNEGTHSEDWPVNAWAPACCRLVRPARLIHSPGRPRSPDLPLLIWENFKATERLLRATISPIFFQSFPWRAWYIFNFFVSPLLYLRERENITSLN